MTDGHRPSKNERRIATILLRLPLAREQLLVAMEGFGQDFDLDAFVAAAGSQDATQRNRVAVIEREVDVLVNLLEELASRALAEARARGAVDRSDGGAWEQLAAAGVISDSSAAALRESKDIRNELDHFYPPLNWRVVHQAAGVVMRELDPYVTKLSDWMAEIGVAGPIGGERPDQTDTRS